MLNENKCAIAIAVIVCGIAVLLLVILLPLTFNGVEYYQYGLKKQLSTGKVDRDKVYGPGRYVLGPDYGFVTFPADGHFVYFKEISVWSKDKLGVEITCQMQYFLLKDHIGDLHRKFDEDYEDILKNNALNALKDAATSYDVRDMFRERPTVEQGMFDAVRNRLGGSCCFPECDIHNNCVPGCKPLDRCQDGDFGLYAEVRYFQLQLLDIPDALKDNFLKQLVEFQKNEIAEYKQKAILVRKGTEEKVRHIRNEMDQVTQNSTAQANLFITKAKADAEAVVENARSRGLLNLYSELNITSQEQRQRFDYLRTLRNQKDAHLTVGYQNLVAGPLK